MFIERFTIYFLLLTVKAIYSSEELEDRDPFGTQLPCPSCSKGRYHYLLDNSIGFGSFYPVDSTIQDLKSWGLLYLLNPLVRCNKPRWEAFLKLLIITESM